MKEAGKERMKDYDVVVIGSGSGAYCAGKALRDGMSVALIDQGPIGGTCPNTGCIPSKMLLHPADCICQIRDSGRVGVHGVVTGVDFRGIMARMKEERARRNEITRVWTQQWPNLDFYEETAHFVDHDVLQAGRARIRGGMIFIASGARPAIPPIKGLSEVNYLTNESILELEKLPQSVICIGGGYIAMEYAHFFSALGVTVTVLQRNDLILPDEETALSAALKEILGRRMAISSGMEVTAVSSRGNECVVQAVERSTGREREYAAERVMVATGRQSNADLLKVENAGIAIDEQGYIKTDAYLRTSQEHIWAIGDANGRQMFRHTANKEARLAWHNATQSEQIAMDYQTIPHAVFTYPPLASVGLTTKEAQKNHSCVVVEEYYRDMAKGAALNEQEGFGRAIVERGTEKILGFHIIGPGAPVIIQEVATVMERGGTMQDLETVHIHPTLSELVTKTLEKARYALESGD
jgi:mycothione reductase